MNIFKKDTEKHTNKLPMTGKVRKGFRIYCTAIMGAALILGTSVTAFAAGDPITVVNNLSSFIFGLIRAIGLILLGFGVVQVGLSLKSHDPSQRANGFLTLAGRRHHYLCQGDPRPDRRLSKPYRGAFPDFRGRPDSLKGGAFCERQLGRTEP